MNSVKPGVQTTEFWMSLAASLCAILTAFKLLTQEQADAVVKIVQVTAGAVLLLVPVIASMWYTKARTIVKNASW